MARRPLEPFRKPFKLIPNPRRSPIQNDSAFVNTITRALTSKRVLYFTTKPPTRKRDDDIAPWVNDSLRFGNAAFWRIKLNCVFEDTIRFARLSPAIHAEKHLIVKSKISSESRRNGGRTCADGTPQIAFETVFPSGYFFSFGHSEKRTKTTRCILGAFECCKIALNTSKLLRIKEQIQDNNKQNVTIYIGLKFIVFILFVQSMFERVRKSRSANVVLNSQFL